MEYIISATYPRRKKRVFLVSTVGNIFPSLTQFLPVAIEMDHSVHNSDNEIKSIKHPLFTLWQILSPAGSSPPQKYHHPSHA